MILLVLLIGGALFIALDAWLGMNAVLIASMLLFGGVLVASIAELLQSIHDRTTAYRRWVAGKGEVGE